jgi:hypothetical protein
MDKLFGKFARESLGTWELLGTNGKQLGKDKFYSGNVGNGELG